MKPKRCECCGQIVQDYTGIAVDEERGEIRFRGKMLRSLTENEFAVFSFIYEHRGRVSSKESIIDFMYQLRPTDEVPEEKIVDVYVCKIRKKIALLGLEIETVWGRGYYFVEPKKEEEATWARS